MGIILKWSLKKEVKWCGLDLLFITRPVCSAVAMPIELSSCHAPNRYLNEPNCQSGIQLKYGRDSIAHFCAGNVNLQRNSGLWIESPVCKSWEGTWVGASNTDHCQLLRTQKVILKKKKKVTTNHHLTPHRKLSRFLLNYLWGRLQTWTIYYRWWHGARLSEYSTTGTRSVSEIFSPPTCDPVTSIALPVVHLSESGGSCNRTPHRHLIPDTAFWQYSWLWLFGPRCHLLSYSSPPPSELRDCQLLAGLLPLTLRP